MFKRSEFTEIRCQIRNFVRNSRGISLVEFALIAPFLVLLLLGGVDAGRYMMVNQKLGRVAAGTSDLAARTQELNADEIQDIFAAAEYVLRPFRIGNDGAVILTSVSAEGGNPATIDWQQFGAGEATVTSSIGDVGDTATLPAAFNISDGENAIVAEVFLEYSPIFFDVIIEPQSIYHISINRPRYGSLSTLQ